MHSSLSVIDGLSLLKVNNLIGIIFEKVKIFHNGHNAFGICASDLHQIIFSLDRRTDGTNTETSNCENMCTR